MNNAQRQIENFCNLFHNAAIQTDQRYPRAGSQSYPFPAAEQNSDGSMTLYFGPEKPKGVAMDSEGHVYVADQGSLGSFGPRILKHRWFCVGN